MKRENKINLAKNHKFVGSDCGQISKRVKVLADYLKGHEVNIHEELFEIGRLLKSCGTGDIIYVSYFNRNHLFIKQITVCQI